MNYRRYAVLFLIIGMLIGCIPPVIYHLLTIPRLIPSASPSPWDTQICAQYPSSQACDGKYPTAPTDLTASLTKPLAGNGACLAEGTHTVDSASINNGSQHIGTVDLWWSPRCQVAFAHVSLLTDGYLDLFANLQVFHPGLSHDSWHKEEAYTASYSLFTTSQRSLWSVLIYSPSLPVQGCGYISYQNSTFSACTDWYQAGKHVGLPKA